MKKNLIFLLFAVSFSCSAIENVIFNDFSFPLNESWRKMILFENGEGFATKKKSEKALIVNTHQGEDSLITLENGSKVSITEIHKSKILGEPINSDSNIYKGIFESFSATKKVKVRNITFFVEIAPDSPTTQVAYIILAEPELIMSISAEMPANEFLNYLKSIKPITRSLSAY
jgi:hypothetical protein